MRDAHGAPLDIGDYVGYITGGRNPEQFKGVILEIRKKIKVEVTHPGSGAKLGETRWVHGWRATRTLRDFDRIDREKERQRRIDTEENDD